MSNLTGFLNHILKSASGTAGDIAKSKTTHGAIGGAALAILLGQSKELRKAASYSSLGAIGAMVYNSYKEYQQEQAQKEQEQQTQQAQSPAPAIPAPEPKLALPAPQTADIVPQEQVEMHGTAVLRALVAAAKADGHVNEREREIINAEIERQNYPKEIQNWLNNELAKPLDPAEVAKSSESIEMAAEMYVASLLVLDEQSFMEKAYITELARQLKLPEELQIKLQNQLKQAQAV